MFAIRKASTIRNFVKGFGNIRNTSTTACLAKNVAQLKKSVEKPFSSNVTVELQKDIDQLMFVFPDVIRDLTLTLNEPTSTQYDIRAIERHFQRALSYNVPHGKKIGGLTALTVYKDLMANEPLTPEKIRQAQMLSWCIEILQSAYILSDDIIDGSEMRYGKPCWHTVDGVKMIATNDILMIENACFQLLKRHFDRLPCYANMVELLHETELTTFIGLTQDFQMSSNEDVNQFNSTKYRRMADYKVSHSAVYTPIALPMMIAGYKDENVFKDIQKLSNEIGYFHQVQHDFLAHFGETDASQTPSTDIQDNKCTWLAVSTMEHGNDEQKEIMRKCYGKNDPECIDKVEKVYDEMNFPDMYARFEEQTYDSIKWQIELTIQSDKLLQNVMINALNRTFNRT